MNSPGKMEQMLSRCLRGKATTDRQINSGVFFRGLPAKGLDAVEACGEAAFIRR
jgi:hypothetical protein